MTQVSLPCCGNGLTIELSGNCVIVKINTRYKDVPNTGLVLGADPLELCMSK